MGKFWRPEFGYEKLLEHEATIRACVGANEAKTRLLAIDTILFEVLGWDRLTVDVEKHVRDTGYADYAFLQSDKSISMILEAKRDGVTFILPNRKYPEEPVGFSLIAKECRDAEAAMGQAAGYASSEGSRFVAITNGHQWVFSLAFVPYQKLVDRSVFVFESIDAIKSRFQFFWRCFGPEGISTNQASMQLLESRKAPAPAKLSTRVLNYPAPANRNIIGDELSYIVGLVWDEMNAPNVDENFLRQCYVSPASADDEIALAKELLEKRVRADEEANATTIDSTDTRNIESIVSNYYPEKPIIILGQIGHGKSTFLKFLRLVKAKEQMQKYIQIDIDFLDRPETAAQVPPYIYDQIDKQLLANYDTDISKSAFVRGVLHFELERFREGPRGRAFEGNKEAFLRAELDFIDEKVQDKHAYLTSVFRHLRRGRGRSVALFLDNLDRQDDSIQESAFLRASAMARDWECLVFVCLRPGTFYASKDMGVMDSVASKIINVNSPKTSELLQRRFYFSKQIAEGKNPRGMLLQSTNSANVSLNLPRVAAFLAICEASFAQRRLSNVFDAVSNGNIRSLLLYVKQFITSKHLNTRKIIDESPTYRIPDHEAVRAFLFGDYLHYDPNTSTIINLFDIVRADPLEHFSRLLCLNYLVRTSVGSTTRGYCSVSAMLQYLCDIGYSIEHSNETVHLLYEKKCCESLVPGLKWKDLDLASESMRATSLGRYLACDLVNDFLYYDAVVIDTPILDDRVRKEIGDVSTIEDRIIRAQVFFQYLNECSSHLRDPDAAKLWQVIHENVTSSIQRTTDSAARTRQLQEQQRAQRKE